jgi:hypothetical protein
MAIRTHAAGRRLAICTAMNPPTTAPDIMISDGTQRIKPEWINIAIATKLDRLVVMLRTALP